MQEITMPNIRVFKVVYYVVAVAFHLILIFTDAGNYFHGGTPVEWIALQSMAVMIAVAAIKLLPKVGVVEKILVALCAFVPIISVIWSLISALVR
jgi:hypothetical protein